MKILELELVLYRRLSLNTIRYFKLTLKEIVQLILGTNGSGKSSILYELSPLPANHKNYYKGGRKRILIAHDGKTYELISDFKDGQEHYFMVDGVNLNTGRTVTVQRELVKTHFNLTNEYHELMLGYENFTSMSPSRRRELFTALCVVDYTYAIKLYKRIQEALRDTVGSLRTTKKRLAAETANTVKVDDIAEMRQRLTVLTKESQSMYMLRNVTAPTVANATTVAQAAAQTIQDLTNKFHGVRKVLRDRSYFSPEEYQSGIDDLRDELSQIQGVYARVSDEFIKASVEVAAADEFDGEDIVALKEKIISNNERAKGLLERRKKPLEGFKAVAASQSMEMVHERLCELLSELPADPEGLMSSVALAEVNEKLRLLQMSLNANKEKLAGFEHQEKHLLELANSEEIDCPKCEHKWRIGYSEQNHLGVKARIEQGRAHVATLMKEIREFEEKRDKLVAYSTVFREYTLLTRNTPELQPLWDMITAEDSLRSSPAHTLTLVELVRADLLIEMHVSALREGIKTDMQRLEAAEYAQSASVKSKRLHLDKLEKEIGILSSRQMWVQNSLQDSLTVQRQIKYMYDVTERVKEAKEAYNQSTYRVIDAIKNEVIDQSLEETHREIAALSTRINSIDQQEALLRDLANTITALEKSEKAYKALAETLSPTEGLIAEGMLGFIRNFVGRMNALIAKIWTYRMEVHDCSTEKETAELNYKFPFSTPNLEKPIDDISEASSGQGEMIDLAFKVIAAQCLNLDKGPLFLDEFGKKFDEAHQSAATQIISQLMEQLNFSQLFMISHYESCYGAFYNAQISVIDKRNITVPGSKTYNEFTEMTA